MFTTGRIIFIALFITAFTGALIWSYSKERGLNKVHFNKAYKVLLALIAFFTTLFIIVKIRKFL